MGGIAILRKRETKFFYLSVFIGILLTGQGCQEKPVRPPNILFIILDAARADHFSCHGYNKNTTPYIDAVSRKGIVFLNNFSPATGTASSVPKIFSSRYFSISLLEDIPFLLQKGWEANVLFTHNIFFTLDKQQIFLPEILSQKGYRTGIFSSQVFFRRSDFFMKHFDVNVNFLFSEDDKDNFEKKSLRKVISWLKKNKGKPFFAYCHLIPPHSPYLAKEEEKEFLKGIDSYFVEKVREKSDNEQGDISNWSEEEIEVLRGLYDGNLKRADKLVGLLYEELIKLGLVDQTIVIITADHGENLGEHNYFGHGGLPWDTGVKVPLIVSYPSVLPSGVKVKGLTESIDIMPTILDICRLNLPKGKSVDGVSLLDFINNPQKGKEAVFFGEGAIRTEEYKCIFASSGSELYNLRGDPGEVNNIADNNFLVVKTLRDIYEKKMGKYQRRFVETKRDGPPDFSFAFFTGYDYFVVEPENIFLKNAQTFSPAESSFLEKISLDKPWICMPHGLLCYYNKQSLLPSIKLSTSLPKGTYRVNLLLESDRDIRSSFSDKLEFRFRFVDNMPFSLPERIERKVYRGEEECYYFSIDLGEVTTSKEEFSLEIEFSPKETGWYLMRLMEFIPKGCQKKIEDDQERQRVIEDLKSLGYL